MIPKIIHYCWFGNQPMPEEQQKNITEWSVLMPDYRIMCWNENNMDLKITPFISQAYESGKFAFVADYTRLFALKTFGGIYMDTDVKVNRPFDDYLNYSVFTSYEFHPSYNEYKIMLSLLDDQGNRKDKGSVKKIPGAGLMSAIIAAKKDSRFINDCLKIYNNISYAELRERNYTIPSTLAITAEKYGFRYKNEFQLLDDNIAIFPTNVFADYRTADKSSIAVHLVADSWGKDKSTFENLKAYLYRKYWVRTIYMSIRNLFEKHPLKY